MAKSKKLTPEQKSALKEGLRVFVWAGLSAVLPMILVYMEGDARYATLIPVVNAVAYSLNIKRQQR